MTATDTSVERHTPVSSLGRRLGPVVALLGVLGAATIMVWLLVAPDNVVGPVAQAPFDLDATAVVKVDEGGALRLVDGDGDERVLELQGVADPELLDHWAWWDDRGRLRLGSDTDASVVDVDDGSVRDVPSGEESTFGGSPGDAHVNGNLVRAGATGDDDADVLLDLGGPVGRLRQALRSPDGRRVAALDEDGRVLVADTSRPDEVHVWFEVENNVLLDRAIRWDG